MTGIFIFFLSKTNERTQMCVCTKPTARDAARSKTNWKKKLFLKTSAKMKNKTAQYREKEKRTKNPRTTITVLFCRRRFPVCSDYYYYYNDFHSPTDSSRGVVSVPRRWFSNWLRRPPWTGPAAAGDDVVGHHEWNGRGPGVSAHQWDNANPSFRALSSWGP